MSQSVDDPQADDVLEIVFCAKGYNPDPPLMFIIRNVMRDAEIHDLNRQFRNYRRRGFRVLDGIESTRLGSSVTLKIEPRRWRFSIVKSPQAIQDLAQMIATRLDFTNFQLTVNERKVIFSFNKTTKTWEEVSRSPGLRLLARTAA